MILEILKSTFKSWTSFLGSRYAQLYGRGTALEGEEDELLNAKTFQHAGLRTFPGPGTEFLTIKNQWNVWTVAENDSQFTFTLSGEAVVPKIGDVIIYQCTTGNPIIYITQDSNGNPVLLTALNTDNGICSTELSTDGNGNPVIGIGIKDSSYNPLSGITISKEGVAITSTQTVQINGIPDLGLTQTLATASFVEAICTALSMPVLPTYKTSTLSAQ